MGEAGEREAGMRTPHSGRLAQRCQWAVFFAIRSRANHFIPHLAAAVHVPWALSPASNFPISRGALKCTFEKTFAILREKDCVKSEPPSL